MSGIGEAGLVLAVFPLVISALDQSLQGLEKVKDWWKVRKRYQNCKHSIELEKLVFEENLEQLLSMLVHDDDELKRLIVEPGGEAWRDPELELGLQQRLPKSYNIYLSTIHKINGIMEKLKHDLGVNVPAFQSVVNHEEESIKRVELVRGDSPSIRLISYRQPQPLNFHSTPVTCNQQLTQSIRLRTNGRGSSLPSPQRLGLGIWENSHFTIPSFRNYLNLAIACLDLDKAGGEEPKAKVVLTDEPYISKDFPTTPSSPKSSYNIDDHGISTLGIILLELSFDTPLEEHGFRRNLLTLDGEPNPLLDLAAAMQWCDRYAIDETGPELARVIDWCLRTRMTTPSWGREQAWREELFTMVVEPLQNCYNQLVATAGDC